MEERFIYTRNYYSLQLLVKEQEFVELLNSKNNLLGLVSPFIEKVKNELYNKISQNHINELSIDNKDKLDKEFFQEIQNIEIIKKIDNKDIKEHLFSISYKKLINRLFKKDGYNDEKYFVQNHIHSWIEFHLAKSIVSDNRFSTFKNLSTVIEQAEMLHDFYQYLIKIIPIGWINNDLKGWINVNSNNLPDILDTIRTYTDYFQNYEETIHKYQKLSPFSFVKKTTNYYEYAMFSKKYSLKNDVLFNKNLSKWIVFWDNLKFPILQDILLYFKTPYEIIRIAECLYQNKSTVKSNLSHLACILLVKFFDNSLEITEKLTFYIDDEKISSISEYQYDENLINEGKRLEKKWSVDKPKLYGKLITELSNILSYEDIEEWVFSYEYRTTPLNEYTDRYNSEIDILISAFSKIAKEDVNISKNFNFQKFNLYANLLQKNKIDIEPESFLKEIIKYIHTDKFYWDKSFSKPYWETFKNIGYFLSISKNPLKSAIDILNKVKVFYEGWNIQSTDYKSTDKEIFIICGLLMLFEHKNVFKNITQEKEYFNALLNHILTQYRFAGFYSSEYIRTVQLMLLIVNQIYQKQKLYFESEIITNIDNIGDLLKVFAIDKIKLENKSKNKLRKRIDKEILIYKRKIDRKYNKQELELIDKIIEKLNID